MYEWTFVLCEYLLRSLQRLKICRARNRCSALGVLVPLSLFRSALSCVVGAVPTRPTLVVRLDVYDGTAQMTSMSLFFLPPALQKRR